MKKFIILAVLCVICGATDIPKWPKVYSISGRLKLPYAEIDEPFTAWYDPSKNRSRVDYYNSTVITIQLSQGGQKNKYGQSYKIAPVFLKDQHQTGCFLVNGTASSTVVLQPVLPDLTGFKAAGSDKLGDKTCDVWQKIETIGQKKNVYTMWTEQGKPVRYEMMGYDTLLGSHYDKYYLDYQPINSSMSSFPDTIFQPNKELMCGDFPGPGDAAHRMTMNPMQEYIQHVDSHIDDLFRKFKNTHQKQYPDKHEHNQRKHIFRQNVRFIDSKNRAGLTFSLKLNHLADRTDAEISKMRGYRSATIQDKQAIPFSIVQNEIPDQLDWRLYGAVTPVKDQAACGSCWSFGTAETVEGAYFLKMGELVRLSQQELMDCTWDQGNNGCDGGEDFRAYQWIMKHGLATEEAYGPYLAQDGYCHYKNVSARAYIKGYVNVSTGDQQALKVALAKHGPISVGIDANHKSLSFYGNGVYYEKDCGSTADDLDHAVLAVGYGVMNGEPYWLIKNSWSTYWGNDGYVLMSQKNNNCGVATTPTFVLM